VQNAEPNQNQKIHLIIEPNSGIMTVEPETSKGMNCG